MSTTGINPDSKVHGANMGPIWGRQDPGEPHVGHMKFAIWELYQGAMAEEWVHGVWTINLFS